MKKITDERLVLRNLQHIKITYIVQTIGILSILGYELIQGGLEGMRGNPLWLVFMLTMVVNAYLSMRVSVEHERGGKNPKQSFMVGLLVLLVISCVIGYFTSITPNFGGLDGLMVASILFICGFIPLYYVYRLRMKQEMDLDDE